ncbi:MAG: CPBP family glutamic-type intramembrane protease [Polyangiaceae bacterium]|nr:CPBP family glutamic-type intramembrane protease [Polyangiaceae bacterium]
MSALGQIVALTRLLARHWVRSALTVGGAAKTGRSARSAGVLLRLAFLFLFAQSVQSVAASTMRHSKPGSSTIDWLLTGVLLLAGGLGAMQVLPAFRGAKLPLRAELLETLPVTQGARLTLALFQNAFALVASLGVLRGAASPQASAGVAVLLGVSLFLAGSLTGLAVLSLTRVLVAAHHVARFSWLAALVGGLGWMVVQTSKSLGLAGWFPPWHGLLAPTARALAGQGSLPLALALPVSLGLASGLVLAWSERRGYDRLVAPPPGKPKRVAPERLTLVAVDRLLTSRETSLLVHVFFLALPTLGVLALLVTVVLEPRKLDASTVEASSLGAALFTLQIAAMLGLNLANRSAARDARARPLLAPLTLVPADTLRGKERSLRRLLLPASLAPFLLVAVAPPSSLVVVLTRALALLVGMALLCNAAPSLAFLTSGLGAGAGGTSMLSPATLLLLLPLLSAVAAPNPWAAALSLLWLGLFTFEARRAALQCVRWLDDEADDVERDTPVWRALLVLGAFFAIQALAGQLLAWLFPGRARALHVGAVYVAGAIALLLLTWTNRQGPRLTWLPARRRWLVLVGPLAGLASGAFAQLYLVALRRFDVALPELAPRTELESIALALAVVLVVPVAEEVYFRGWLQQAVAAALPEGWQRQATLLTALGFALVHPSLSFVPVLLLGVLAGALYAFGGALLPALLAHATHNAVVAFFDSASWR